MNFQKLITTILFLMIFTQSIYLIVFCLNNSFIKFFHPINPILLILNSFFILFIEKFKNSKQIYKYFFYFNVFVLILFLNEILFDFNYSIFSSEKEILYSFFGLEYYLKLKLGLNSKLNIVFIQLILSLLLNQKWKFTRNILNSFFFFNSFSFLILDLFGATVSFQNNFFLIQRVELINNFLFSIFVFVFQKSNSKDEHSLIKKELIRFKEKFQITFKDSSSAIATFDLEYKFISLNNSFLKLFNLESDSTHYLIQFITQERKNKIILQLEDLKQSRVNNFQEEIEFVLKNNHFFWGLASFSYSFKRKLFIIQIQEITKMKKIEEDLQNSKLILEKKDIEKSIFIANANHEIRSPLNLIINFSNFIIDEAKDKSESQILSDANNIKEAGYNLLNLISEIIEVEKINTGQINILKQDFNLKNLILEILEKLNSNYSENKNRYNLTFDLRFEEIRNDREKIKQILFQVLDNAFKFTQFGKIFLEVRNIDVSDETFLFFSIEDSGIGIPEDKLKNLFNPFQNLNDVKTKKFKGIGLGLNLAKNYIEILNGRIEVDTKEGIGTKIKILLPI